jgi:putative toxin-antitoxin system antitoxin component (TIGR02293 family)
MSRQSHPLKGVRKFDAGAGAKPAGVKALHASKKAAARQAKSSGTVYNVRGGSLGMKADAAIKVIEQVNRGFPFKFINNLQRSTELPLETIAEAVRIPSRTLSRRKAEGKLQPDESERLFRLSVLFERAVNLFEGDKAAAMQWLRTPQPALGGERPLDFARTEIGAGEVQDLIGRLEHGVYT